MNIINPQENDVEREHRQAATPQARSSLILYEVVVLTVLILGVEEFFRTGSTTLIYIACLMAAAYAGPIARNLLSVLKEILSADKPKEP